MLKPLILVLCLFVCSFAQSQWNYLEIVQRWPATDQRSPLPSYITSFNIHGLWPNYNNGSYPSYCTNDPFVFANISSIYTQLSTVWYDIEYNPGNSSEFWCHEWNKHGTCTLNVFSGETAFFSQAIKWHSQYSIDSYLSYYKIVPSQNGYPYSSILSAVTNRFGKKPMITCEKRDGKDLLHRVILCVDTNLNPIDCPSHDGYCSSTIYMLPISH